MGTLANIRARAHLTQKQKSLLSKKFDFCTSLTEKCNLIRTMREVLAGDAEVGLLPFPAHIYQQLSCI